jgi:hypothetical protein
MLTYADVCYLPLIKWRNGWRMLTYADVCWRMLTYMTYADVCSHIWRMLTYAHIYDVCWHIWRMLTYADIFIYILCQHSKASPRENACLHTYAMHMLTYADVCWRMLTYADVCSGQHSKASPRENARNGATAGGGMWRMLTYADVCWRMLTRECSKWRNGRRRYVTYAYVCYVICMHVRTHVCI